MQKHNLHDIMFVIVSRRSRKQNFLIVVAVAVVLVAAAGLAISRLNQPVHGTVSAGQSSPNLQFSINLTPVHQYGPYASFNYPKGLQPQKNTSSSSTILQQLNFIGRDVRSWVLATAVVNLPAGELANNSSYELRLHDTKDYEQSSQQVNGQPITVFTDTTNGGFSKVAFWPHGNVLATISLIGDDEQGQAPLQKAFTMVLSSWQWQ